MRIELKQVLFPQPKSKIKAGDGKAEGKYKFFTSSPIQSKFVDEANYDKPSLIFGTGGNASVHFCNEPFSTSTDCLVMYGRSKTELETIYNYLKSNIGILENGFKGAGLKHISKDYILAIEIDLPSEEIQLDFLQKNRIIDGLIEAKQAQLHLSEELVKSRFIEMFGDGESPIKTVEELCSDIVDCPHTTPKYEGELKNPAIRTSEIKKGYIAWETMRYVSDEEYEERTARLKPEAGDIVYGREGTFGNAAILPGGYNFCLGQRVMLLRPDYSKCTSEYLLHSVISDDVYRQATEKNNASTVAHVNVKDVKQFKVPLPSFDKQNQFAAFVEQTDKSKYIEKISVRVLTIFWQKVYIWK